MITFHPSEFRVPTRSTQDINDTCVEFACKLGVVELRDSKVHPHLEGHALRFPTADFAAWVHAHNTGDAKGLCLLTTRRPDGLWEFRSGLPSAPDVTLLFNQPEVDSFLHDVEHHHYDADLGITPVVLDRFPRSAPSHRHRRNSFPAATWPACAILGSP